VKRPLLLAALACSAAVGAACGSDDAAPLTDDSDKRAVTRACLEAQGIEARESGEDELVVGDGAPRIRFFLTAGEAEAAQFGGDGEGAEHIGPALMFVEPEVNRETEGLLEDVENCLAEL